MKKSIETFITLDVLNEFSDILNARINTAKEDEFFIIYVGDCLRYTKQLFINNGWSEYYDSEKEIYDLVQKVLCLLFQANHVFGIAEWSNDTEYIIIN